VGLAPKLNSWLTFASSPGGFPRGRPAHYPSYVTAPATVCSAKGCRQDAAWALRWNNPKIHTPERRKTWLACDNHRDSLSQFLSIRGFLRDTEPMPDAAEPVV
jgi:hypothetical protein